MRSRRGPFGVDMLVHGIAGPSAPAHRQQRLLLRGLFARARRKNP